MLKLCADFRKIIEELEKNGAFKLKKAHSVNGPAIKIGNGVLMSREEHEKLYVEMLQCNFNNKIR